MKIGTKSILFGVHQFLIHPWFVAWGWWKLYGFPWDPRLWIAFFLHDLGYFGKPNMDGPEGETHPYFAANIMGWVFGNWWFEFCFYHSRFLAKKCGQSYSRLCVADKMAIALYPFWIYISLAWLSGELKEYMEGKGSRTPANGRSTIQWYKAVQNYCGAWAVEHKDCDKEDTWTGTKRDLEMEATSKNE